MHSSLQLLERIQNPRLWSVIKAVHVTSEPCHHWSEYIVDRTKKCTCGGIDQKLGTALQSIQTLEVLGIRCNFCRNHSTERHRYLMNLETRRMRHFSYECHCSLANGFDLPTFVTVPWTQSLNGLFWPNPGSFWNMISSEQLEELLKNPSFLPQLNTLHYSKSGILDTLLTRRKIVRLSGAVDPTTWTERYPNKKSITHLSVHTYRRILNSPGGITQFCNLQHLGTLFFDFGDGDSRNQNLAVIDHVFNSIMDLKLLSSIDGAANFVDIYGDPWDEDLWARLESAHPKLRKVFLSGYSRCAWVRRESSQLWKRHEIPHYTSWDMVTDRFEHI